MNLKITENAKLRIQNVLNNNQALRVLIKGSGCAGFQYIFELDSPKEDDYKFFDNKVIIDPLSAMYLDNSTLDFKDELFSKMFVISNPSAKTVCGCGSSFSL
jgi:iron-sulfur cluster insertion protein